MKRLCFFLFLSVFSSPLFAQYESDQDSLETLLPFANDRQRIDILNALSITIKGADTAKAMNYVRQAFALSNKLNYCKGLANSHIVFGIHQKNRGNYDVARQEYLTGLALAIKCRELQMVAMAYYSLGNLDNIKGNYPQALRYYIGALRLSEQINDNRRIARTLNNIGSIYLELNDYERAEEYYSRSYEMHKAFADELSKAEIANNLANIYLHQNLFLNALNLYNKCLETFRKYGSIYDISSVLNNIGMIFLKRGQNKKAMPYLLESMKLDEESKDYRSAVTAYINLNSAYTALKEYDSAVYYGLKALQMAKSLQLQKEYIDACDELSNTYSKAGDEEKALFYLAEKNKHSGAVIGSARVGEVAEIAAAYEKQKKQHEIQLLNKEKEIQRLKIKEQQLSIDRRNTVLIGIAIVVFFLIIMVILVIYVITLSRKKKSIEFVNKTKSDILQKINHELRTPLNSLVGMSTLAYDSRNISELREYLLHIYQSADELVLALDNIINYLRIESGDKKLFPAKFNFVQQLGNIFRIFNQQCSSKGLLFNQMVHPDVPNIISADKSKVQSLVQNLLNNALRYSESGVIKIEVKNLNIREHDHKSTVSIAVIVSDEGYGIADRDIKSIFKGPKMNKEDMRKKITLQSGFGLGLKLVKEFAERMNGKVEVKSLLGQGSVFTAIFEAEVLEESVSFTGDTLSEGPQAGSLKILVAEDNLMNQKMLQRMLEKAGHQVRTANNGEEALALVASSSFDIIILDIQMPVMTGLEVAQKIRNSEEYALDHNTPMIAVSADADPEQIQYCMSIGFNDYISKPIVKEYMLTRVNELGLIKKHKTS